MIAAAALVAAAGSASAQQILKADIPFAFRTDGGLLKPGSYDIRIGVGASRYLTLFNNDTLEFAVIAQFSLSDPAKEVATAGVAKLRFQCVESHCTLLDLWTGPARSGPHTSAYVFRTPKLGRDDTVRIAEIRITHLKAD
jgi:hypothetical protein